MTGPGGLAGQDAVVSIADAARSLGISVRTLRRWSDQGRLTTLRQPTTGRRLFFASDLMRLRLEMLEPGRQRRCQACDGER